MKTLATMFALSLAATAVDAQTIRAHPSAQFMPLRVFDATGKLIGGTVAESAANEPLAVTLLYSTSTEKADTFTVRVKGLPTEGNVGYGWAQGPSDYFYFLTSDCTGQAYVKSPGPMPGGRLALLDTETNLLYLSERAPVAVGKQYDSLRIPLNQCLNDTGPTFFLAVAVDPVIDMDDVFTQPFAIR